MDWVYYLYHNGVIKLYIVLKTHPMGKLLQGINGPFSGKVGPVVGYMLNNQAVIRSLPGRSKKPLTPKKFHQRGKFALMNDFLGQLTDLLNLTYGHLVVNMTGYNKAFSYNVM